METTLEPIQYIEIFLSEQDIQKISLNQYSFNLKRFFNWVKAQGKDWKKLSRGDILQYKHVLQSESKTNLTVVNYVMTVRLFYKWLNENNITGDITQSLKLKKQYTGFKKLPLTADESKRFLASFKTKTIIQKRDFAIANLMLRNGLREIEITRMDVGDIIERSGVKAINIRRKGKFDKTATLPISQKALETIEDYLLTRTDELDDDTPLFISFSHSSNGKRLAPSSISRMIKKQLILSNFIGNRYTAHSLRHTTASLLITEGFSEYDVQNIMGHSSFTITQLYTRYTENDLLFKRNLPKCIDNII